MEKVKIYTERQLNYARAAPVFDYLVSRGEAFNDVGRHWSHTVHDSLTVSKKTGIATWRSRGNFNSYNNAIEFISEFYQEPYEAVVQDLLDFRTQGRTRSLKETLARYKERPAEKSAPFSLDKLTSTGNHDTRLLSDRGREYLRSRFLSDERISEFAQKNLISSDDKENILFKIGSLDFGKKAIPIGAVMQGTFPRKLENRIKENRLGELKLERKYYKGIAMNSHSEHGFLFGYVADLKVLPTLFVTEAPIESFSLLELSREKMTANTWYLSLNGLKDQTLWRTVEKLQELFPETKGVEIVLALNNDEKGREAVKRLHSTYQSEEGLNTQHTLKLMLPELENGDWNEVLELTKTGRLDSREEKEKELEQAREIFVQRQKQKRMEVIR